MIATGAPNALVVEIENLQAPAIKKRHRVAHPSAGKTRI